jgi:hypothetical protein
MAITDINISEELETNAPSIKYRGDEGPRSPQQEQQMMMAQLEEAYGQYVDEMIEMGQEDSIMPLRQFIEQAMAEGQMAGGNPLPQDPTKPVNPFQPKPTGPVLPDRQMAAYGGIMGVDGRRQYGIGSSLKKAFRKIIPNEVAEIAVKAAPFVAPFNPLAAAAMSGLGSFDQTGRIGSSLKSGLMNYALGQGARYLGGADFQGMPKFIGGEGLGGNFGFSKPTGSGGIKELFNKSKAPADIGAVTSDAGFTNTANENVLKSLEGTADYFPESVSGKIAETAATTKTPKGILTTVKDLMLDNKLLTGLAAGTLGATALMGNMEPDEIQDMQRGEGLDIEGIRAEVIEAFKDESGEKLAALRVKYPFLGRRDTKDLSAMAMGGRIGKAEGGIMDLGGMEKDYRAEGGFVPIGKAEKADDVPARLSVNEFVFTADAVRNAGGGDIDKGAEVMENMMKNLEAGGQVSEESQGMAGAQQMFETSERLSEVI